MRVLDSIQSHSQYETFFFLIKSLGGIDPPVRATYTQLYNSPSQQGPGLGSREEGNGFQRLRIHINFGVEL